MTAILFSSLLMMLSRYLDPLGVAAVAVEGSLRAGRVPALDEILAAFGIHRACQACEAVAKKPVGLSHRISSHPLLLDARRTISRDANSAIMTTGA